MKKIQKLITAAALTICVIVIAAASITPKDWRFPWTVKLLELKASSGDVDAAYKLYMHYAISTGTNTNALYWLRIGAESGSARMQFMYASILDQTSSGHKARYWYCRASSSQPEAAYRYASLLRKDNLPEHKDLAIQLYQFLAYQHHHVGSTLVVVNEMFSVEPANLVKFVKALNLLESTLQQVNPGSQDAELLRNRRDELLLHANRSGYDSTRVYQASTALFSPATMMPVLNCGSK